MKNFKRIIKLLIGTAIIGLLFYWIIPFIFPVKAGYIADGYKLVIENPYDELEMDFNQDELRDYINENKFVRITSPQYRYTYTEAISLHFRPANNPFNSIQIIFCVYDYDHSVISDGRKKYKLNDEDIEYFEKLFKIEDIEK